MKDGKRKESRLLEKLEGIRGREGLYFATNPGQKWKGGQQSRYQSRPWKCRYVNASWANIDFGLGLGLSDSQGGVVFKAGIFKLG